MASTQILPPPYKGQNDQFPVISIQNPNCERMENMNNKGAILALRKGHDNFAMITGNAVALNLATYSSAFSSKIFLLVQNTVAAVPALRWYDITAGGAGTLVNTVAVGGDDEIQTLYYNGYLYYMGEVTLSGAPQYYSGSAWGAAMMTWAFNPFGGCVYKNRGYFLERQGTRYAYTGIDQVPTVANTPTTVDLASIISSPAYLYAIRSISTTQAVTPDNVLAFLFSNGEIIVYYGGPFGYPDGANWGTVSRFKISEMIYNNTFIDAKGDTFIFTKTEILSLRNLFLTGYDQERQNGIGASIQRRWAQIVQGLTAFSIDTPTYIKGVYDEKFDRLMLNLPKYVDPVTGAVVSNSSSQLIYDFILGGWYEYWQVYSPAGSTSLAACYNDGALYNSTQASGTAVVYKLDSLATYIDDDMAGTGAVGIAYKMRSAPLNIPKFGANAVDGVEAICKTDLYPQTNYKFIGDLGRVSTAAQVLPDQGSSVAKPMMNVGLQSVITTQLEISGTSVSSSLGLEIYALNVWYNQGPPASR